MPGPVYRVLGLVCALVEAFPIGTNLGLLHLCWMLLSGQLLGSRGAIFPGLQALGLSEPAIRRAWVALGQGRWTSRRLLKAWAAVVQAEGLWHPHVYGGYHPVAVDITAFWRPKLRTCPTQHGACPERSRRDAAAGQARPAIVLGLIARVGSVQGQRFGLPLEVVRADPGDPSVGAHLRTLLDAVVQRLAADEVAVTDREFTVTLVLAAGVKTWVTRLRKNFTARRATPPAYRGRGRRPIYGAWVRPLARRRGQRAFPATPPDHETRWTEAGRDLRADQWHDLVLTAAAPGSPTFSVTAIYDPAYTEPLLVATPLPLAPHHLRALYRDRWPVEQLPLAAKQMLGAARQFVHAKETCQRFPELTLLAGAVLTYAAATSPAVPTGSWDRQPRRTPGRLRRVLALASFPQDYPWPERLRVKRAVTAHLPKGCWGQRRSTQPTPTTLGSSDQPSATPRVA